MEMEFRKERGHICKNKYSEKDWKNWDEQIEADLKARKLDFLIKEARDEKKSGKLRCL